MLSHIPSQSDSEIMLLLRSNCKEGTMALYDRYARHLLLLICRKVSGKQDAEHVLARTFVIACRTSNGELPEASMLLPWMMSIAREQIEVLNL